ncbi:transcriptional regulator ATRX [Anoplophora glabripennis]|nr:transcriptional regulator ATRX [Anoplophora glabripennis]
MEPNESEKYLITLREHLAELLDNISDIGTALNKKSNSLLHEVGNTSHTDIHKLEKIGLGMIKMLKILNINVVDITNLLERDLEKVNENRSEKLFADLCSKMFEYNKLYVKDLTSNSGTSLITSMLLNKDTQTDCNNVPTACDIEPKCESNCENVEVKPEIEAGTETNIPCEINNPHTALKSTKVINLGLIRTDTQDTDDCWIDSINRNTTALELWNRKYEGEKIIVTDEYLNNLKEEQTEDNEWDRKTEDLNYNFERKLSSGDDTFVDGKSPKEEEASDERTSEKEIEVNPVNQAENKESLDREEHETSNPNDPTRQLINNSEELLSEQTKLNSEGLEINKSNFDNECNNKDASDISNALDMIKERLVSKEVDDSNKENNLDSLCCSTNLNQTETSQTYSKQIISDSPKPNVDVDSENSCLKDAEEAERNKADTGSLSSLDESMSSALLTLVDHLEAIATIDPSGTKETEGCIDKSVQNQSPDSVTKQLSDNKKSCFQNSEQTERNRSNSDTLNSLDENMSSNLIQLCDHLEDVASVEEIDSEFHDDNKLPEDNCHQNNCSNEQILEEANADQTREDDSDKISSETTYSQETVILCTIPERDETDLDEDANKLDTSVTHSQIVDPSKCVDEMEHLCSEENETADSDETDIGENSLTISELMSQIADDTNSERVEHLTCENNSAPDSDKTNIDKDACKLSTSESSPQTISQTEYVDKTELTSSKKSHAGDVSEENIDEDVNKLPTSDYQQTASLNTEPVDRIECLPSEKSDSNDDGNDEDTNKLPTSELLPEIESLSKQIDKIENWSSEKSNSDVTDIDEDTKKLPISEIFPDIPKNNNFLNSTNNLHNDENILAHNNSNKEELINKSKSTNEECLPESSNMPDSDETVRNDLLMSEISKQILDDAESECLSGTENKSDSDVTDLNEPNSQLSVRIDAITENDCTDSTKKTGNIEEDGSSECSNKSFVFHIRKNEEIGDTENDNFDSANKSTNIEEENSSHSSNKSFVFNIDTSENLNCKETQSNNAEDDQHQSQSTLDGTVEYPNNNTQGGETGKNVEDNTTDAINMNAELQENENCQPIGATGDTIEIISDSDDDDVRLDVTMEEIVDTGSPSTIDNINAQEDVKKEEVIKGAIEDPELIVEENIEKRNTEEYNMPTTQQIIGDELLELLREVEVPSVAPLSTCARNIQKTNNKKDIKEADEIFKMLLEESTSDISDSEISDDNISLSQSDTDLFENVSKSRKLIVTKNEEPVRDDIKDLLEVFDVKDCYVSLEKLQLEAHEVVKVNKDDSIDRLCDLTNIIGKRKHGDSQKIPQLKRVKKRVVSNKGTSDSESLSDYSHSDSDSARHDNSTFSTNLNPHVGHKLDDLLANEICNDLKNDSSNESTDVDSDDPNKTSEKTKSGDKGKIVSDIRSKHLLSKEERIKKAWKNDPLLRGKLTSDDESTSDSEKSSKRRKALRSRYEHDTDFNIVTEENDSDSDNSHTNSANKFRLEDKIISPIKKNIPISDSSSDTDSDIEIITSHQQVTPPKNSELGDELGPGSSQKGRRNIRALMSDESLAEATQRANKEEQERIERLEGRHRIKESLSQSFTQLIEEDTLVLDVDELTGEPLVKVHPKLSQRLKPHQKSGIQFMWDSCYESLERLKVDEGSGCILAHCMGLGKTFQVITLLHTLFSYEEMNTKHVLVVCPTSTVANWKKEVKIAFKHFSDEKLNIITIVDKREVSQKYSIVKRWYLLKKCVLVLGYECFETLTNETKLEKVGFHLKERMLEALIDPGPDLVICDEGHLLRNKKALKTLALNKIRTKRRIVLTGTPLQNNLLEYYYMVNFVKPNLLGNMKEYKTNFVNPITNGQYEDSTSEDIKLMMKRTHVLHKLLKKTIQRVEDTELKIYLPKIVDHAVFIQLHQVQVDLYNKFSELVAKNSTNTNKRGFLSDFSIFQYICTHPHLLAVMENLRNKKIRERDLITDEQEDNPMCNIEGWWKAVVPEDAAEKIEYGHKLMVVKSIIEECEEIGDKVLVFSQSLGELNLIEHFLEKEGTSNCHSWKKKIDYCRMDGTVPPALRSTICDLFNDKDNKTLRLLLMSTKVGGLGLNLTAANRVIIMTVNWNPSYDIQSVFRVYRFGQEKEVYVYRLIALDSMEEKVYQRTVTKLAIAHRVVDKHQITRHYKSMDLQELYSCKPDADTERPICNVPEDKVLAKLILKLPYIYKQHEHQALLKNRPEDNLNEHELNAAWDEFKRIKDAPQIPPPQHLQPQTSSLPQVSLPNGPTYSMAYDLTRPVISAHSIKKVIGRTDNGEAVLSHYFIPSETNDDLKKTVRTSHSNVIQNPKIPSDTVVSLESREDSGMIPVYSTAKTDTEDPLYIPLSEDNKTRKSYGELLSALKQKQPIISKLPLTTTIVLEDSPERSNQKENRHRKKSVETSKVEAVVILDDEPSKATSSNLSENAYGPRIRLNNIAGTKRKRNNDDGKQAILKKMREGFNKPISHFTSISVDDDDDVTEIANTSSESGSLSNELISNLGRSGITIHKVIKDVHQNNGAIITLD